MSTIYSNGLEFNWKSGDGYIHETPIGDISIWAENHSNDKSVWTWHGSFARFEYEGEARFETAESDLDDVIKATIEGGLKLLRETIGMIEKARETT